MSPDEHDQKIKDLQKIFAYQQRIIEQCKVFQTAREAKNGTDTQIGGGCEVSPQPKHVVKDSGKLDVGGDDSASVIATEFPNQHA